MRTALATVGLSGTLSEKLDAIVAVRFKGVETFKNGLLSIPRARQRMPGA